MQLMDKDTGAATALKAMSEPLIRIPQSAQNRTQSGTAYVYPDGVFGIGYKFMWEAAMKPI